MTPVRIAGAVLLAVGLALLGFAWHASQAPLDQLTNTLTGRFSDQTMWYCVAGIAAVVGGVLMVLVGRRG
jgi:hypothetical protein